MLSENDSCKQELLNFILLTSTNKIISWKILHNCYEQSGLGSPVKKDFFECQLQINLYSIIYYPKRIQLWIYVSIGCCKINLSNGVAKISFREVSRIILQLYNQ